MRRSLHIKDKKTIQNVVAGTVEGIEIITNIKPEAGRLTLAGAPPDSSWPRICRVNT